MCSPSYCKGKPHRLAVRNLWSLWRHSLRSASAFDLKGQTTRTYEKDGTECMRKYLPECFQSPEPDHEGNNLGSMSRASAISTTSRRELSSSSFFLQGKEPKEFHSILTETLACFHSWSSLGLTSAPVFVEIRSSGFKVLYLLLL